MHKAMVEFGAKRQLKNNGKTLYGFYRNYEINLIYEAFDNSFPIKLFINCYVDSFDQNRKIVQDIRGLKINMLKAAFSNHSLVIMLNGFTLKSVIKKLDENLDRIFDCLVNNNLKDSLYCPYCGKLLEENKKSGMDGNLFVTVHPECLNQINDRIEKAETEFKNAPNNYGKGIFGAVLGGLVGLVVAFIFFLMGLISAISSFVSIALGAFLYKKLGGKPNVVMIISTICVTLLFMLGGIYFLYVFAANDLVIQEGISTGTLSPFAYCMQYYNGFSGEFSYNIIMTLVFTAIASICEIFVLRKSIQRQKQYK